VQVIREAESYLAMLDEYKNGKLVRENQSPQAKLIRAMLAQLREAVRGNV
jgi:hypothetical protein